MFEYNDARLRGLHDELSKLVALGHRELNVGFCIGDEFYSLTFVRDPIISQHDDSIPIGVPSVSVPQPPH